MASAHTHHEAAVHHAVPGTGQMRAYWVDESTLAWPADLLPPGVRLEDCLGADGGRPTSPPLSFGLVSSPDGSVGLTDGLLQRGERGSEIPLGLIGRLDSRLVEAHPQLDGYLALTTQDEFGAPRLIGDDVALLLTGQLAVVQRTSASVGGWVTAYTGVQTWPVIDRLWGQVASARDGSAPLGVSFSPSGDAAPSFALWAPTAVHVDLLTWPAPVRTGSVPLAAGDPVRLEARRCQDGRWEVTSRRTAEAGVRAGCQYLWEVRVYVPATGKVETNFVTDPYSRALTVDSRRSVAVDLGCKELKPSAWCENLNPTVAVDAARAIYELHLRDFSAADPTVPPELRGTYEAFTIDSAGTRHLRELAQAGIDTVHLLPVFDFSTVPEDRGRQRVPQVPEGTSAASRRPQAAVGAVADLDAYNWGYDPFHWMAPEGSYATDGHQDGGARTVQVREMIGALHGMGLQVVLDQVFNHTAGSGQEPTSVLDRIVPGYYHRLDATGQVESSTCCNNVATERAMAERLMIDACVSWVRDYRVDGFRFDLMGYHSTTTMKRLRQALAQVSEDAVGHEIYLYGEGWNMGEVADNALFRQAVQGQVGAQDGLHIGTFNDRVRDALYGGNHFGPDPRQGQGLGTGAASHPSGWGSRGEQADREDLRWRTDLVRLSLAGNLREMELLSADGTWRRGQDLRYGLAPAGYGDEPVDSIAYVDAHDDETLFDRLAYKLPPGTSMEDRVRLSTVCLAAITLGQSPCFWAAGTEMLRSKSLDRDSYNSGDHFNAIDWSGQDNGWGRGLPPAGRNFERWIIQAELLSRADLRPSPAHIAAARAGALDLLRLRRSTPLLTLGSAELIHERVSFPVSGREARDGVIIMVVDDGAGQGDLDPALDGVMVAINATNQEVEQRVEPLVGRFFELSDIQAEGADERVKSTVFDPATGLLRVPALTAAVLVER
ncbi:pullulanase-type alpha-1,6-glucosidase [uncultured Actinomyces sp.]|uniref:pullulanase-type alpha-1,6-glucosidase n=1 Tax=uncultured Actinomyces sp. TaxID=249061 RepID=UPI002803CC0B|nr:pullulanase-type alpha-1,6-glucosidase [uncultured Actinomyces sp.]